MKRIFYCMLFLFLGLMLHNCKGQTTNPTNITWSEDFDKNPPFYYKMPEVLTATDTSPLFKKDGQKILLTGKVFKRDGVTPASNVILYYYQTNTNGVYEVNEDEPRNMPKNKLGQTQGYIRGWVKTDNAGKYAIYTVQPGSYPSRDEPAHVHINVKEDSMKEPYYLDDFVFDNDVLLTSIKRQRMENRGGSGVIRFVEKDGLLIGERNIILGLNIPNYPIKSKTITTSGKQVGEDLHSFTPYHAYGPDKGTRTCPICKYGWYHGILYTVGNNPNWDDVKKWLTFLEGESIAREKYLKVYFIYGDKENYNEAKRTQQLEALGKELQLKNIALTFVPSLNDTTSEINLNNFNPEVESTIIMYKRSTVIANFTNLKPTPDNFNKVSQILDNSTNEYFKMPRFTNK
ncbi:intradiol ring-cleavage dioxygenase [Subsaxibacter sp. CAU 1640]|uniref:dioxygenase family protein n=1 Tax=Subsaxibacter sp. CAU 1640 TaxID=2933271 RepID=UPI0020053EC4|nr:intradiol ring-cleavage dioxygenase [Subsaxibacter sp. CAU 1640]MCK7591173.1 intradiol ring-cleavage dioxygenase [Subsaxibacter sp. CAU 1640]